MAQANELEADKGKIRSLEEQLAHKDSVIEEQKYIDEEYRYFSVTFFVLYLFFLILTRRLLEIVRDQSVDSKREFESLYRDVMVINSQLEAKILELQDQMTGSGMGKGHAYSSSTGKLSWFCLLSSRGKKMVLCDSQLKND